MFIPAEAIFYDLLVNEVGAVKVNTRNLIDYALNDKKVCIVSPTTFSAYLQSILYGFKAFRIEKQATEIIKKVDELGNHLRAYQDYINKLGNSLGVTVSHYNSATKEFEKIDKDVTKISGNSFVNDFPKLDRPNN
jgi:DNA recombination protein RmuC